MSWRWIDEDVVLAIHEEQLAAHGGESGLRDAGLLQSALARPQNLAAYGDEPDAADLAAAYAYGITRNHPFVDGNNRTAFVVMEVFLQLNGHRLTASDADCLSTMLALAEGSLPESQLAHWIRVHVGSFRIEADNH
jgi:death-on-curing protein